MAKAALNMLTCTSAGTLFQERRSIRQVGPTPPQHAHLCPSSPLLQERVLINCVDTGWVTDMAPGGVGARASLHATHVGPPLDEEDGVSALRNPSALL
eukprot:1369609-Prymnesium_polylepis.1